MAKRTNSSKSNKSWIFGTVLGAVAGAAYALWKTPMSGQELRGKLSPGPISTTSHAPAAASGGFGDKIISTVERTLAPIVGVELGKTANGSSHIDHATTEPIAVNTVQADTSVSTSLRARRFEWGSPAPETTESLSKTSAPETVVVAPNLPETAPEPTFTSSDDQAESADYASATGSGGDTTASWGTGTLRANRFASSDAAPAASPEPTSTSADEQAKLAEDRSITASGEDTTASWSSGSLRANRFASSDTTPAAAPEVTSTSSDEQAASAEYSSSAAPSVETSTNWSASTLRSNRFAWGEAAPEAMTVTPAREVAPVEAVTTTTAPETDQASRFSDSNAGIALEASGGVVDPLQPATTSTTTGSLHPFPKLGGLEDNV